MMNQLQFDIGQYIAKSRMSEKKRLLVEGKEDKDHISNLLQKLGLNKNVIIDVAENIRGSCNVTKRNNRAKIDKIHEACKKENKIENLFFLIDREFLKFQIDSDVKDLMKSHETDENLSWTIGHSFENYFLKEKILTDAFRFLSGSSHKNDALILFSGIRKKAIRLIASITLAAKEMEKCSYPAGVIAWSDFEIAADTLSLNFQSIIEREQSVPANEFSLIATKYIGILIGADEDTCERICRGHTALIIMQRVFAACLYSVISTTDTDLTRREAHNFNQHKELVVSGALSEAWVRFISLSSENDYPSNVVRLIQ